MRLSYFCVLLALFLVQSINALSNPCPFPVVQVTGIAFSGNNTTKAQVLERELTFSLQDSIKTNDLDSLLEDNRKRLFNLRLFHTVAYRYTCDAGNVQVTYTMQERFYLYPIPVFDFADRNFNAWLEKKDWSRIDYGLNLTLRNFRGRNEDVRARIQQGFNQRLELVYRIPYISRKYKLGLELGAFDYRSRTVSYTNRRNKQVFFEQESGFPIRRTSFAAALLHRVNVQRQAAFVVSYQQEQISDSVNALNPEYYASNVAQRQFLRLDLSKTVNLRNNFAYPLKGSYFEAGVGQQFFLNNSGSPITTLRGKYVTYKQLADKYYYMAGAEGQVRLAQRYTFADNVALGFRSNVRGYELYVTGGQHFGVFKQGLTRELLNIESIKLKFIRSPKFNTLPLALYLNAFTDAGYVIDKEFEATNALTNRLLAGAGLGLHAITFYDIVLRLEYTLNREGDRGVYFSTRFPF